MGKVYIFGRGTGSEYVKRCIKDSTKIVGFIDNYSNDSTDEDGIPIVRQSETESVYDYIIISLFQYKDMKKSLVAGGIPEDRIICFFDREDADESRFASVIDPFRWKTELMWKYQKEVTEPFINNQRYELYSEELEKKHLIPKVINADKTIGLIIDKHLSLARYGDGEFEMMCSRLRLRYQTVDSELSSRLIEILHSDGESLLIAIANNYGNLDKYTDYAAAAIRQYLTPSVRKEHMELLDLNRDYYDAYLSRPYFMYRDKKGAKHRFDRLKEIWRDQDILIVEGKHTRSGVGNDLFMNAKSVIRILTPDKNAYDNYGLIFEKAQEYGKNRLVLSVIGPTATVLSYDLAKLKYWAVDIGQVDTEYEWYLHGTGERCDVPYKTVSEYIDKTSFADIDEKYRQKYESEIVAVID